MKQTFLFSASFLCLFISGCSTITTISQDYTQICPRNNSNECPQKQCCLKEAFDANINKDLCVFKSNKDIITPYVYIYTIDSSTYLKTNNGVTDTISACSNNICSQNAKKDVTSKNNPSNITINPSISFDFSKKNDIHTDINYHNKKSNDFSSQTPLPNTNINVSNIRIENKNSNNDTTDCSLIFQYIDALIANYFLSIILTIVISFLGGIVLLIPSFIRTQYNSYKIKSKKFSKTLKQEPITPKPDPYYILSPTSYAKVSSTVLDQLKFAILDKNRRIKNIAITGPYGSGKSSIWKTFCRIYNVKKIKRVVKISLAKFNNPNEKNLILNKNDELEIERAIIQQLIFSKTNAELKYSNFPKINNLTDLKTTVPTSFLFFFFVFVLPIINDSFYCFIESWVNNSSLLSTTLLTFFLFFFYITIFWSIQKLNKTRITKICLNECEITLGNNESLFSKYINDIVYFFEATKCNCVVIEDLDRFNSVQIFSKLREINDLINHYPAIKDTVKFVYLIRDDIISKYERTKFFDFIINIVPILTVNNSASITKESLKNKNINLSDTFLNNIEDYLKDYRLVKNCINESVLYKNELLNFNIELYKKEKMSLSDDKLFSLILYKNLYPKDFSKLQKKEGILFDCLNRFQYDINPTEKKSVKESRDLLSISDNARKQFREYVDKLNIENKYGKNESIDPNLLILLFTKKYIDNDYEYYITKTNDSLLTYDEHTYLFNIKNDIPESQNLILNPYHLELLKSKIKDHEWNSPGILNDQMIDYILKDKYNPDTFTFAIQIVEAMYSHDQQDTKKFIPEYFHHCKNTELILQAIANIIITPINTSNAEKILESFFLKNETDLFIQFLKTNIFKNNNFEKPRIFMGEPVSNFLDSNESFKNSIFNKYISNVDFIKILEKNTIAINLSKDICFLLGKKDLFASNIYKISINNFNTILSYNKLDTNFPNYITRCLAIKGLKLRIEKSFSKFFNNIVSNIDIIDEKYESLKFLFSHKDSNTENKKYLLEHTIKSWELYVLYCQFASLDDLLENYIASSFIKHNLNTNISASLLNDEPFIEKLIRSVFLSSKFTTNDLNNYFIPFWSKFISILKCFEGYERIASLLTIEKNNILQEYAVSNEKDNLNIFMIHLIIKDSTFFEKIYPEEEYSKESNFQLELLDTEADTLKNIQKKFFSKIQLCPNPNDNQLRFSIYKKAGKNLKNILNGDLNILSKYTHNIDIHINEIKGFDLEEFQQDTMGKVLTFSDQLDSETVMIYDPWAKLLWKTLNYWFQKMCTFIAFNTFSYGNNVQGLKESDKNDDRIVRLKNSTYQSMIRTIEFWIKEIEDYMAENQVY